MTTDCTAPVSGDNTEATNDGPDATCDDPGSNLLDMWYTFNSGAEDTVSITLTPSAQMTDWAFVVYDGCAGAEVICQITPALAVNVEVTPGTDYWVRVYSNPAYGDPGPFTLCVSTPVITGPPPPNDVCSDVVPQPLAIGSMLTFTGTNIGAIDNEGLGYPMVWEAFTLSSCADVKISFCGTPATWNSFWFFLNVGCPPGLEIAAGSYDSTACADGLFTLCFANLAAGSYYYPIVQTGNAVGPYTLNVSAAACGTDVALNDECAGAIPLTANPTCEISSFTNPCATQSL
ncbi:MAG: hypothetical protein IPJ85_12420 [Flavobacteriales bacterium]|nr:hypothetical protein [Flavobacteriales bacterium]